MSYVTVEKKLITKLRTDATLLSLVGGTSRGIGTPQPKDKQQFPYLAVSVKVGSPAVEGYPNIARYILTLCAFSRGGRLTASQIGDRVQVLFSARTDARTFYDFSDTGIAVKESTWKRRNETELMKDVDGEVWKDVNVVEIIADTVNGCP